MPETSAATRVMPGTSRSFSTWSRIRAMRGEITSSWAGQGSQHLCAVERVAQPLVQQYGGSPISGGANQAPKARLENNDHFWQQVVIKGVLACALHGAHACCLYRVAKAGIRQLLQKDVG